MTDSKRAPSFWRSLWGHPQRRLSLIGGFTFLLTLLLFVLVQPEPGQGWKETFSDYIDPGIAIGTLAIAAGIWLHGQVAEYRANWPRKLHVVYALFDAESQRWEARTQILNAPLTSEADIRQWGQSIAQTVANSGRYIHFSGFRTGPERVDRSRRTTTHFLLIFLSQPFPADARTGTFRYLDGGSTWERIGAVPPAEQFPRLASILDSTPSPQTP